jgi:hypothetical protein
MAVLAYLVRKMEMDSPKVTVNEITKKAPEFLKKTQRNQRIQNQLEGLKEIGFVKDEKLEMGTIWEITKIGYEWYKSYADGIRLGLYRTTQSR